MILLPMAASLQIALILAATVLASGCPCPKILARVCGDDGKTYDNDCLAKCAGVQVAYKGRCVAGGERKLPECPKSAMSCIVAPCSVVDNQCKGREDLVCLDSYCPVDTKFDGFNVKGGCSAVFVTKKAGLVVKGCLPQPECMCPKIYKPVCGEDGKTYGNTCEASCYRLGVKHEGECKMDCTRVRCGNNYEPVCGKDGKTYENKCQASCVYNATVDYEGQCSPHCAAITCPAAIDPVCGKDGKQYPNECLALCEGTLVDYKGECKKVCKCSNKKAEVCGKDGKTYRNECQAECTAAVQVAYKGKCKPPKSSIIKCKKSDPGARCSKDPCKGPGSCDGKGNAKCLRFYCTKSVWFQGVKLSTPCSPVYVDKNTGVLIPCK